MSAQTVVLLLLAFMGIITALFWWLHAMEQRKAKAILDTTLYNYEVPLMWFLSGEMLKVMKSAKVDEVNEFHKLRSNLRTPLHPSPDERTEILQALTKTFEAIYRSFLMNHPGFIKHSLSPDEQMSEYCLLGERIKRFTMFGILEPAREVYDQCLVLKFQILETAEFAQSRIK